MDSSYVINLSGEKEQFSFQKVYRSAKRAGASAQLAQKIAEIIEKQAYPGIKTSEIFKKVKQLLGQESPKAALKFNLKKAMQKLGPTGFIFEKFVGEIFEKLGYKVKINQFLPGGCIRDYEIDFIAQKNKLLYVGECKYRNLPGERVGSKDALANFARFSDILNGPYFKSNQYKNFKIKTIMVANTKFTKRAIDYSACVGAELLGWRYPKNKGLEYLIESQKLYPITILPSLNNYLADYLVSKKIMLAQDVLKINAENLASKLKIPKNKIQRLIQEAKTLLK
ncbi:restriction endonuclease [Candidatus Parcubacteria bacterium]|nr:restriction endonuclease [Candidatus Parcubacteria bacterium]